MATKKTSGGRPRKAASKSASSGSSGEERSGQAEKTTKRPAGRSTPRKSASRSAPRKSGTRSGDDAPRASAPKRKTASSVAASAAQQLLELTGKQAEGVTGLERTDDGWTVQVEVVEVRRIPDTTDVLALYEVDVDDDGDLTGYHRVRRYARGVPGED